MISALLLWFMPTYGPYLFFTYEAIPWIWAAYTVSKILF